jgi:hypothetical protein
MICFIGTTVICKYNWLYDEEQQQHEEGHALSYGV